MILIRRLSAIIKKIESNVGTVSLLLLVLMIVGKLAGFLKVHFIARFFGVSQETDVFYAAFALPDLIFSLLVVGTVNAALIPIFSKIRKTETRELLEETLNTVVIIMVALLFVFALGVFFFIPSVADFIFKNRIASGFVDIKSSLTQLSDSSYREMYINLSRLMIVSPILLTISSIFGAYLQSHKKFFYTALAPVFYNIAQVAAIVGFVIFAPQFGIYALAYAVVIGSLTHMIIQSIAMIRLIKFDQLSFKVNKYVRQIFFLAIPRIIGLAVEQIAVSFSTFWSFIIGKGAASIFGLATPLYTMPIDIISGSFLQAIFPHLTDAANKKDNYKSMNDLYIRTLVLILLIGVPIMILLIVLRIPIVRFAYGAGRFSWAATITTSFVLAFFAPAIILQSIASLNIRTFYAIHNTKTPLIISILGVIAAITSSIMFTNFFSHYQEFMNIYNTVTKLPSIMGPEKIMEMLGWFFTRGTSAAAVAGLAFGVTFALFIEVAISFFLLSRITHTRKDLLVHPTANKSIINIIIAGILTALCTFGVYKMLDTVVVDTAYTVQLGILCVIVTVIGGGIYTILTINVLNRYGIFKKFINIGLKFAPFLSRFIEK